MAPRQIESHDVTSVEARAIVHSNLIVKQGNDGRLWAYQIRSITRDPSGTTTIRFGPVDFATMTRHPDDRVDVAAV